MGNYILLASICFAAMVSPGPDFLLMLKNGSSQSRASAFATAFGIVSGCAIGATYCTLGLALVIAQSIVLFSLIKYLGACYLIWIGFKCLVAKGESANLVHATPSRVLSVRDAYVQGLLCNLLNPKLAIFLLSLFTQFISPGAGFAQKGVVAGIFLVEALIYWPTLALLLQTKFFQRFYVTVRAPFDRLCGALLIALGVRVAVTRG